MGEAAASNPVERTRETFTVRTRRMRPIDAVEVARCHVERIPTGFLSRLGIGFLSRLYTDLCRSGEAILSVAVDRDDRVVGFICGTTSVNRTYRKVLTNRAWLYALLLLRHAWRPSTLRRIVETLSYPSTIDREFPEAELLSIAIDPCARGTGASEELLRTLIEELRRRRCDTFKVLVGADLGRANAFYLKRGMALVIRAIFLY